MYPYRRLSLKIAFLVGIGFIVGATWHRYHLPPFGMGLADGDGLHSVTKQILARPDNSISYESEKFTLYDGQSYPIVMLGDSLTASIHWNELLGREDIAGRGIGSDLLINFEKRLDSVLSVHPRIVFILGGINDLRSGISEKEILNAYGALLDALRSRGIVPVVQTLPLTHLPEWNQKVIGLNSSLVHLCRDKQVQLLDLSALISSNDMIVPEYTTDGVHLSAAGYRVWKDAIAEALLRLAP